MGSSHTCTYDRGTRCIGSAGSTLTWDAHQRPLESFSQCSKLPAVRQSRSAQAAHVLSHIAFPAALSPIYFCPSFPPSTGAQVTSDTRRSRMHVLLLSIPEDSQRHRIGSPSQLVNRVVHLTHSKLLVNVMNRRRGHAWQKR